MTEKIEQASAGVASELNAELDTSHDCELCGSNCNERDELIKCEREINQLRVQNTDFILALIKCKNKFDFFRLLHIKERDTEKAKAHAEMVKMLSDVLGYGTPQVINEWQAIDTLSQQNWLNDGNVYEETEVIFCDEYGAYCGNVKSGTMPNVWVTFEPTGRQPTHWRQLPVGI